MQLMLYEGLLRTRSGSRYSSVKVVVEVYVPYLSYIFWHHVAGALHCHHFKSVGV